MRVAGVRVAGFKMYSGPRWREAFEFFASDANAVRFMPKISFLLENGMSVTLQRRGNRYYVYGLANYPYGGNVGLRLNVTEVFQIPAALRVVAQEGLSLSVCWADNSYVVLKPHDNGSELCVWANNLPSDYQVALLAAGV